MGECVLDVNLDHVPVKEGVYRALMGENDQNMSYVRQSTGADVIVMGRGCGNIDYQTGRLSEKPMQIILRHPTRSGLEFARSVVVTLLESVQEKFKHFKKPQMIHCDCCDLDVVKELYDPHCKGWLHRQKSAAFIAQHTSKSYRLPSPPRQMSPPRPAALPSIADQFMPVSVERQDSPERRRSHSPERFTHSTPQTRKRSRSRSKSHSHDRVSSKRRRESKTRRRSSSSQRSASPMNNSHNSSRSRHRKSRSRSKSPHKKAPKKSRSHSKSPVRHSKPDSNKSRKRTKSRSRSPVRNSTRRSRSRSRKRTRSRSKSRSRTSRKKSRSRSKSQSRTSLKKSRSHSKSPSRTSRKKSRSTSKTPRRRTRSRSSSRSRTTRKRSRSRSRGRSPTRRKRDKSPSPKSQRKIPSPPRRRSRTRSPAKASDAPVLVSKAPPRSRWESPPPSKSPRPRPRSRSRSPKNYINSVVESLKESQAEPLTQSSLPPPSHSRCVTEKKGARTPFKEDNPLAAAPVKAKMPTTMMTPYSNVKSSTKEAKLQNNGTSPEGVLSTSKHWPPSSDLLQKLREVFRNQVSNRHLLLIKVTGDIKISPKQLKDKPFYCKMCQKSCGLDMKAHYSSRDHALMYLRVQLNVGLTEFAKNFSKIPFEGMDTKGGQQLAVAAIDTFNKDLLPPNLEESIVFREVSILVGKQSNFKCEACSTVHSDIHKFAKHVTSAEHYKGCIEYLATRTVLEACKRWIVWPSPDCVLRMAGRRVLPVIARPVVMGSAGLR